jgi:ABC-2 type transport system ATP-binding protein
MIAVEHLTKRFGRTVAVDDLSFSVRPGTVTGFLGPNGSGKSTTMRCMLGLDRADGGAASFGGRRFVEIAQPLREVAALLDAGYVHPGRSGRNHLRWMAASNGLSTSRVDEVLQLVGLTAVAGKRVRQYSLGMRQRLGLAGVLLGDPHTIILDEPANGLDPEGIRWIRDVLTYLARQGRTVLVSSHLLSEMALIASDLVVIGRGRLLEQCTVPEFVERYAQRWVRFRSPTAATVAAAAAARGIDTHKIDDSTFEFHGVSTEQIGELAAAAGAVVHELSPQSGSLEDAFLSVTAGAEEYQAQAPPTSVAGSAPGSPLPPPPPPQGIER